MANVRRITAFTLVELLVVIAIIALLISILLPSLAGARFTAKTAVCLTRHRQIATGCFAYATENSGWYPYRTNETGGHPHWWSGAGADMHLVAETYLVGRPVNNPTTGPVSNRKTPDELTCAVNPQWFGTSWPRNMNGILNYATNINVYAGFDIGAKNPNIVHIDPDEMPLRQSAGRRARAMSGDYVVRFGPAASDTGWSSPHTENSIYHTVSPGGYGQPEEPVPFSFEDGSARVVRKFERTFNAGEWNHYWAAPGE